MRTLIKKIIPRNVFRKIEPMGHLGEAMLRQAKAGFPAKDMKVIGVTGTDGKTSTCTLITAMLRDAGYKVGMMTTISVDYGDGKGAQPNPSRLTTLSVGSLIAKIQKMKANHVEWLVLETTSHALAQHRVWAIPYSVAVLTNLGHEHLDYHGTFENYRAAKKMLFEQTSRNKKGLRVGIANADDPNGELFASAVANPVLYGVKKGGLRAHDIKLTPEGSTYTAKVGGDEYRITCHLPGSFNVYNSLAAVGVGRAVGLTRAQIEHGIASLHAVEGRMTRIDEGQDFAVIVDYAHTPESFEKLFKELRPLAKGRIIVVFGSAGRRDEAKRPMQGQVAGRDADVVIVTEEDDRDMDGQEILEEIAYGARQSGKQEGKDLFLVHDRENAVQTAVDMARKGDVVVLLGKGHEKSILGNGPKAAELRHIQQDDTDPRRVVKRDYDEIVVARRAVRRRHRA
ncbi:MAG TPA: UDP-N-acetylmuramoyl-L-alanyl-D-glutamate--2,6-diaminopimelate ligase [Candidatus Saccharimonadales bacterium]|nr:UDP-N-acetylmuramoyl-L-alanyl-D-glutamate--2,6-diaminopimelate ligase [Candidatus Saccharimonadales bacterium]